MLEAVQGELCLLEVLDVMPCCSVCWKLWSFRNLLEVLKPMRCILLCMLEAVES